MITAPGVAVPGMAAGRSAAAVREVLLRHATGVAVITAGEGAPVGLCATSLATVSLDPPTVSFAVGIHTASWQTIATARLVLAHLLGEGQEELARRFGRSGPSKFAPPTRWRRDEFGLPRLDGALTWLLLAPVARFSVDRHALVVSHVVRVGTSGVPAAPLIHHAGCFGPLRTE